MKLFVYKTHCKSLSILIFLSTKVLKTILRIPRGGHKDVKLQFTIPFVSEHLIIGTVNGTEWQSPLLISPGVHNESGNCNDPNKKNCDIKVSAFKKQEANKYATDEWKTVHNFTFYNKDDGDFTPIDKHITLRLVTGGASGTGSKLFDNIILPDIQVFHISLTVLLMLNYILLTLQNSVLIAYKIYVFELTSILSDLKVYIEDTDSAWKGAYCESHTDPHMKTFDQK